MTELNHVLDDKYRKKSQQRVAWLLILGIIFIAATLRTPITTVGPIVGLIKDDLAISNTLAGFITTVPLLAFALFSPIAPKLGERFGMEKVLFYSIVFLTIGIVLRSLSGIVTLYIGTAIIGLAISVGNVVVPGMIKRDFPLKVGLITGIFSLSMNASSAISSGLSVPLALGLGFGWRWSLAIWGLLCVIAIVIWLPQLKRKQVQEGSVNSAEPMKQTKVNLWKSKLAWQVTLVMGLQSAIYYTLIAWYSEILIFNGFTVSQAGWLLTIILVVSLPFYFIVPIIAERSENQRIHIVMIAILYLIGIIGTIIGPNSMQFLWSISIGIAVGSVFSLALTLFSLRTSSAIEAAKLSGMAQSVGFLLAAVGPTLFGFLFDLTQNWTIPLMILALIAVLILIFGLGAAKNEVIGVKK